MRIAIIVLSSFLLLPVAFRITEIPPDEIAFIMSIYAVGGIFLWFVSPIMMAPGAALTIYAALSRIRHHKPCNPQTLSTACWVFRKDQHIRQLRKLIPAASIPEDLLSRIEKSLPRLEVAAKRKSAWLYLLMFACMLLGAICRWIGSIHMH